MSKNKDLIKETKIRIKDLEKNIEIQMKNIKDRKPLDEYAKAGGYLTHKRNVELDIDLLFCCMCDRIFLFQSKIISNQNIIPKYLFQKLLLSF